MMLRLFSRAPWCLALLSGFTGCWSLTAKLDELGGGVVAVDTKPQDAAPVDGDRDADAGQTGPESDSAVPPADGACARALEDAGSVRFKACFDYEGTTVDALTTDSHGTITLAIKPVVSSAFVLSFPPLTGGAGGWHEVETAFAPKRITLAFDLRVSGDVSKMPQFIGLGGFYRSGVNAYLLYETTMKRVAVAEQDQRDGGNVNSPVKGYVPVDLSEWHRIELTIDFEASRITSSVLGGGSAPGLVLDMTTNAPGAAYAGTRYISNTTIPIELMVDNFVVRAD
jgi:hypothetical protein